MYRLIALDVDGTIRDRNRPTSDYTRETIAKVQDAGAFVTLATGRSYLSAVRTSQELCLNAPIATFQGAHIATPKTGEVLWHMPLTSAMTARALYTLQKVTGVEVLGYCGDDVYVTQMTDWADDYGKRNGVLIHVVSVSEFSTKRMTRLVARGEDDVIESLEADLQIRFDGSMYVTRSLPYFCEILHPRGGKDKALSWICDHLDVGRDETIAFGNGYNDIQMMEWARTAVAVDGAVPPARAAADIIAPPMESDGVARILNDLLERGAIG